MIPKSTPRFVGYGVIVLTILGTFGVNFYTLAQIARARTTVPWADQWVMVEDLMKRARGEPLWPILWTPYWGHRLVIPRLLFQADARWLSFASLTWLTVLLQFIHIALLIALAWLLLGRKSPALFMIAIAVILSLMLSPFQIENFVWSMQTMFPLVFVAATGAFLCLSLAGTDNRFLLLSIVLAMVSSYTMPNGILIWPVLVVQSAYLRQNWKAGVTLAGVGTFVIVSYLWHYTRPLEMGMSVSGMIRHPIDATLLVGLILGSPFRFTMPVDIGLGTAALVTTGYLCTRAIFSRSLERRWFSALLAIILFLLLSSLSLVAGRLMPKDLHSASEDFLPVRYFTMICLFWVGIALLVLSSFSAGKRTWLLCPFGVLFVCLMFTSVVRQLTEAEDWADFFRGTDALGSALLMDVPDEQMLSLLWPSKPEREERTLFLRRHKLAMFHEPRAIWPGRRVSELFPSPAGKCAGAIEKTVDLGGSWRVTGWAWDANASNPPDDILLTDSTGQVIGMARGGLRHGYIPGLFIDAQPPPPHARFRRSEWLGYVKEGKDLDWSRVELYGVFRGQDKWCSIK